MVLKKFYDKILLREMIERKHSDWYCACRYFWFHFSLCSDTVLENPSFEGLGHCCTLGVGAILALCVLGSECVNVPSAACSDYPIFLTRQGLTWTKVHLLAK